MPAGSLLLFGPNGAGKSSLIEALYLAATTRSFRAARPEALVRFGCDAFAVRLEVGAHPNHTLEVGWSSAAGRTRAHDGRVGPLSEHLRQLPLLLWWQGEAQVVSGGPEARRRFFDRGTVHLRPGHLAELTLFARALVEKRALLERRDARGLIDWNRLLARHGAAIAEARQATIASVETELAALARASDPSLPPIALRYRPSPAAALAGEEALARELEQGSAAEQRAGRPLVGAQRDEVELLWGGRPAREVASAGERKTIGLLLLAAQAKRLKAAGREPVLLVDDADAELDGARLEQLFALFDSLSRLIVTSNRPELWRFTARLQPVDVRELFLGTGTGRAASRGMSG